MNSLRMRILKRRIREFWKEWGISLEELETMLVALMVVVFPAILSIVVNFIEILF